MKTIEQWDRETRESFNTRQQECFETAKKLEAVGLRTDELRGFSYSAHSGDIFLTFSDLKVLEESLPKLVEAFGLYRVTRVFGSQGRLVASYRFAEHPSCLNVWFEASPENFPIDRYSPGCKIVARSEPSYSVECPISEASE